MRYGVSFADSRLATDDMGVLHGKKLYLLRRRSGADALSAKARCCLLFRAGSRWKLCQSPPDAPGLIRKAPADFSARNSKTRTHIDRKGVESGLTTS